MRHALSGLLVLLVLSAGLAGAQAPQTSIHIEIPPLDAPIKPLQGASTITATVVVPCAEITDDPARPQVVMSLLEHPTWATVTLSPGQFAPDPMRCEEGSIREPVDIVVKATEQAPAYQAAPLRIGATWEGSVQQLSGEGGVDIQAAYFGVLDVQLVEAIQTAAPGTVAVFPLTLTNFGNGVTRVTFEIVDATEGIHAELPAPITLQSRHTGGVQITATVPLTLRSADGVGYLNQVDTVTYRITSAYEGEPASEGDDSTVSVLLTTKGFGTGGEATAPGPALPLLALALVGAALALRRLR